MKLNCFAHELFKFFNGISGADASWKIRNHRGEIVSGFFNDYHILSH